MTVNEIAEGGPVNRPCPGGDHFDTLMIKMITCHGSDSGPSSPGVISALPDWQALTGVSSRAAGEASRPDSWPPRVRRRGTLALPAKELLTRPSFQQRDIDGEALIGQQPLGPCLRHDVLKSARAMSPSSRRSRFLLGGRRRADRIVHVEPDKPAKQQVVLQLLHQQHRVEHRSASARHTYSGGPRADPSSRPATHMSATGSVALRPSSLESVPPDDC